MLAIISSRYQYGPFFVVAAVSDLPIIYSFLTISSRRIICNGPIFAKFTGMVELWL